MVLMHILILAAIVVTAQGGAIGYHTTKTTIQGPSGTITQEQRVPTQHTFHRPAVVLRTPVLIAGHTPVVVDHQAPVVVHHEAPTVINPVPISTVLVPPSIGSYPLIFGDHGSFRTYRYGYWNPIDQVAQEWAD